MMLIGKLDARQRLTVVRWLCGHCSIDPSGVCDQSLERMSSAISPSPTRKSAAGGLIDEKSKFISFR
jgi:hypothetical protein